VLDGGPGSPTARGGGFDAAFATLLWCIFYLLYQIYEMQTTAIDDPSISQSLYVTWMNSTKMAEWINVLFGVETLGEPKNTALDGCPNLLP